MVLAYVAESAASAPPPRGLPFAAPAARASAGGFVPPVFTGGSASDVDEEARPAAFGGPPPGDSFGGDEGGPSLEELESQMSGEITVRDAAAAASAPRRASPVAANDDEDSGPASALPDLDSLVARLPAEVRETLDELFRARFVSVKKLPKKALNPGMAASGSSAS